MNVLSLRSPTSGLPLRAASTYALTDGNERWPVVDGIAFLRSDRDELRGEVLAALDAADERTALAALLSDQDEFAPLPPADRSTRLALVDSVQAGTCTLRRAMRALNFGPVTDYFAHRTCTPTFLSGLGLLAQAGRPRGVVDLACGIGHFVHEVSAHVPAAGVDLVFAKLWLARRFVAHDAQLVCADIVQAPFAAPDGVTLLCHDAFYFVADKTRCAANLIRLAGAAAGGRVLIGHAHNASFEHGVAGTPLSPAEYAALFPGCTLYDDAELATAALTCTPAAARTAGELQGTEATSLIWSAPDAASTPFWSEILQPLPGASLMLNPLLRAVDGHLAPLWPSERFAREYRSATYLTGPSPSAQTLDRAAHGVLDGEVMHFARKRVLLELPARW